MIKAPSLRVHASPLGPLVLGSDGRAVTNVDFDDTGIELTNAAGASDPLLARLARELDEYFAGERTVFDLPLAPAGTPFRQIIWRALCEVPYGETLSYAELATRAGRPRAIRATGTANGANPIAILIPCHRIIGADGSLTGYSGGLDRKRALLALERRVIGASSGQQAMEFERAA